VYIELLEGFQSIDASASGGKLYCCLKKSLYGLKQAPRAWYKNIDAFLTGTLGLTCSKEDPNLYISQEANIILLL
jgi:Reverse transcriptase (RNA-dependent DNA polymerase)